MAKLAIAGSPELTQDEIVALLATEKPVERLFPYAYRVAALATRFVRRGAISVDDGDWQDVLQECMIAYPRILANYKPDAGPLFKYLAGAYIRIMRHTLRDITNGGMGSWKTEAEFPFSYEELAVFEGDDGTLTEVMSYGDNERFGMRDPAIETQAHDDVKQAILFAQTEGKVVRGPNPEWDIPFTGSKGYGKKLVAAGIKRSQIGLNPCL